jgi:hypothetical protein
VNVHALAQRGSVPALVDDVLAHTRIERRAHA